MKTRVQLFFNVNRCIFDHSLAGRIENFVFHGHTFRWSLKQAVVRKYEFEYLCIQSCEHFIVPFIEWYNNGSLFVWLFHVGSLEGSAMQEMFVSVSTLFARDYIYTF